MGAQKQLEEALVQIDLLEKKLSESREKESDLLKSKLENRKNTDILNRIIEHNPYSIQILNADGYHIRENKAFLKLFKTVPDKKWSILKDPQIKESGLGELLQHVMEGEVVKTPPVWYNAHLVDPKYPDHLICIGSVIFPVFLSDGKLEFIVLMHEDITNSKVAKEKLKKSEQRLRHLLSSNPAVIYTSKIVPPYDWTFISDNISNLTGFISEDFTNNQNFWSDHVHPEDRQKVFDELPMVLEKGYHIMEYRFRHKDGSDIWILDETKLICDSQGNPLEMIGYWIDITKRKLEEKELIEAKNKAEESEEQFRSTFEQAAVGIAHVALDGRFIRINQRFCDIVGYSKTEMLALTFQDITNPDFLVDDLAHIEQLLKNKIQSYNIEKQYIRKDKSFVWVNLTVSTKSKSSGEPEYLISVVEDITERKQAENVLKDLIEMNPMSIQIMDKDGFTLKVNPAHILLFNADPPPGFSIFAELQNKGFGAYILAAKNGEVVHFPDIYYNVHETFAGLPDKPVWIRAILFPLINSNGIFDRFVFMHEDITERKKAEVELLTAKERAEESDRLKTAFLCNISHEVRTPMNGILGFADLLKEPGLTGEQQQEYIRIIEKGGARMLNIINDIVAISIIESKQMKVSVSETDINQQLESIYYLFKPEIDRKGLQLFLKNTLPVKETIIKTDQEKLYAILANLVKNAIKYTDSGSIEFGYDFVETLHVETLHATSLQLQFFVKDTGIGIPKDRQEAIFERFIQADIADKLAFQGAGLGLAIAKAYVKILGGNIWVESEPGKGSAFYFTIPINVETEVKIDTSIDLLNGKANQVDPDSSKLKILIAEDEENSALFLALALRILSTEQIKVKTGLEAVEACRKNPDLDLVLMDIRMPNMDGYEATRQIRQFNKDVIIIAQTAFALEGDREQALEAGCNDYLSKPIKKTELMTMIQKYFSD